MLNGKQRGIIRLVKSHVLVLILYFGHFCAKTFYNALESNLLKGMIMFHRLYHICDTLCVNVSQACRTF